MRNEYKASKHTSEASIACGTRHDKQQDKQANQKANTQGSKQTSKQERRQTKDGVRKVTNVGLDRMSMTSLCCTMDDTLANKTHA